MEEKTIITGKKGNMLLLLIIPCGIILLSLLLFAVNVDSCREFSFIGTKNTPHTWTRNFFEVITFQYADCVYKIWRFASIVPFLFYLGVLVLIICLVIILANKNRSITVTDKRVYGTAAWGKRVDLPLDNISAVSTSFGHGIAVASSSGSIKFKMIENNSEIHEAISKLLLERQKSSPSAPSSAPVQEQPQNNIDDLKKLKELLDNGVITQEEFDAKKKQILGL